MTIIDPPPDGARAFRGEIVEPLAAQAIAQASSWTREATIAQAYLMVLAVARRRQEFVEENLRLKDEIAQLRRET